MYRTFNKIKRKTTAKRFDSIAESFDPVVIREHTLRFTNEQFRSKFTQSIDASKFLEEGYDILIGVYGDIDTTGAELEAAANAIVADITHPDIASAEVEDLFDRGINPGTGEAVELEVSFNQLTDPGNDFRPSIAIGVKANPDVDSLAIREATDVAL